MVQYSTMRDVIPRILLGIIILVFVGPLFVFIVWINTYKGAEELPKSLLEAGGTDAVAIRESKDIIFLEPQTPDFHTTGIIFYPGGRIDPKAYIPLLLTLAEAKYPCIIVKMPFRLAIFDRDKANNVITSFDESMQWVMAGHSLGGTMAAEYSAENPEQVEALILIGSYPGKAVDLSGEDLPVLVVAGERDGLADLEDVEARRVQLPEDHRFELISGANHSRFGYYGPQKGDHEAALSREEQQRLTASAILGFLRDL